MGKVIMDATALHRTVIRLSHEIGERNGGYQNVVIAGVKGGGEIVARRIHDYIRDCEGYDLPYTGIDVGIKRDDLNSAFFVADGHTNEMGFSVDGKIVVLCDDILFTGRSAVAGVETIFRLGNPAKIQLLALIDRGGRELPVRADFVGKNVPMSKAEYIGVCFEETGKSDRFTIEKRER